MSLFSFIKEAGEKIVDLLTPGNANASEQLKDHVAKVGLGNPNVQTTVEGDKVTVTGEVASQAEKEKILLALGNIAGVATVEDKITVSGPVVAAARFVVVKKGDTLSAIAKVEYGDANKYNKIFEANKPLLSHPDKIYPGQTLRIPE
ncbi:MAG: peptidoglycan-binding protein LysM [Pseudomonas proteolytica]|uniref:peptidoglycan-binding protein LysM n=1 Tax=Pseudomonas proteolytica TaxID=219574 RepID=UPI003F2B1FB8